MGFRRSPVRIRPARPVSRSQAALRGPPCESTTSRPRYLRGLTPTGLWPAGAHRHPQKTGLPACAAPCRPSVRRDRAPAAHPTAAGCRDGAPMRVRLPRMPTVIRRGDRVLRTKCRPSQPSRGPPHEVAGAHAPRSSAHARGEGGAPRMSNKPESLLTAECGGKLRVCRRQEMLAPWHRAEVFPNGNGGLRPYGAATDPAGRVPCPNQCRRSEVLHGGCCGPLRLTCHRGPKPTAAAGTQRRTLRATIR